MTDQINAAIEEMIRQNVGYALLRVCGLGSGSDGSEEIQAGAETAADSSG